MVIKDLETKRFIQERYDRTGHPVHPDPTSPGMARSQARNDAAAQYLAEHLHEVPVLILCCLGGGGGPSDIGRGASIYPAVQNMLLAARGLGLASVLTTRPRRGFEQEIKELLNIPDDVDTAAMLPLGYPADGVHYGRTRRGPGGDSHLQREVGATLGSQGLDQGLAGPATQRANEPTTQCCRSAEQGPRNPFHRCTMGYD